MKKIDCIEMQRSIRNKLLAEANNDLHQLIINVRENNKTSEFYKLLSEKQKESA